MSWLDRYRVAVNPLFTERRVELVAVLLGLVLLAQILYSALRLNTLSPPAAVPPTAETLLVAEAPVQRQVDEQLSEIILARPLFAESRRPGEGSSTAAKVAQPASEPTELDAVKLLGIFGGGESAGIIVLVKGNKQRILVGETVEDWTLDSVQPEHAVLSNNAKTGKLELDRGGFASADDAERSLR